MKIPELHALFLKSKGVSTDSRMLNKGELFFCLKGANFNGNRFAHQALKKGAKAVIIDDPSVRLNEKTILVSDALETLQWLAQYHRKQFDIPVIGLTGSNGKTTTKELVRSVLAQKFRVHATHGNLNNHIGVPLTLLGFNDKTDIALIEMGANHQREIAQLCHIAQPTIGYITNFGKAHLEGFGGIEGVIKGKSELYDYLRTHEGTTLINGDDRLQREQAHGIRQYIFGKDEHYSLSIYNEIDDRGYCLSVIDDVRIKSNLTGEYNYSNLNVAIAFGKYFGLSNSQLIKGISSYIPENNRSQWINKQSNTILLDAYNANPSSMLAALKAFDMMDKPNKVLVLGDMLELGTYAKKEHQDIVAKASGMRVEKIMLVGPNFFGCTTNSGAMKFKDTSSLVKYIKDNPLEEACIFIKGSRGIALEQLIDHL